MNQSNEIGRTHLASPRVQSVVIAIVAAVSLCPFAEAQRPGTRGDVWVATIAVDNYPKLPSNKQLRCCRNDEEVLVSRLREGNRTSLDHLCRFRSGGQASLAPTKENIEREVPKFLMKAGSDDVVVIFVSMHGARIQMATGDHKTVLLPENADPQNFAETSIPLDWLRDLLRTQVKAKRIMLIMDSCHSGGIRPTGDLAANGVLPTTTRDIRVTFEQALEDSSDRSIYVLTSCDTDEVSLESPDTNHGLFTHWLICGMDGAADQNEDAVVSMDELFGFVCDMVPRSAEFYSQATNKAVTQRPQRILLGANHGDIPLLALSPQTPDKAFRRLSVGIDSLVRHSLVRMQDRPNRQPLIMLAELSPEQTEKSTAPDFGSFPMIARKKIEDYLLEQVSQLPPQFTYGVTDARAIELKQRDIALVDLQEGRVQNGELDAVVFGTFRREGHPGSLDDPDRLCIIMKVRQTRNGAVINQLRTSILIDSHFLMMFGASHDHRLPRVEDNPQTLKPQAAAEVVTAVPLLAVHVSPEALEHQIELQQAASGDHPLFHPEQTTLKVKVLQKRLDELFKEARWSSRDLGKPNLLSFATHKGNQIALELLNQTEEPVAVVVQIDGINQIGRNVAEPTQSCYWSVQPRGKFTVDQWMDRPDIQPQDESYSVAGGRLLVSAPPESVAGRQKVTDRLGEIRIVVYGMKTVPQGSRSIIPDNRLGMKETPERISKEYAVDRSRIIDTRNHKATYVIRYFDDTSGQKMVSTEGQGN